MQTRWIFLCVLILLSGALWPRQTLADGAVAVGTTGNVAADGIAIGRSVNNATTTIAATKALANCRAFKSAPKAAAQCRLVQTFHRKCAAYAQDPKNGTPGAGWAVASNTATAEKIALSNCRATAGPGRQQFCQVTGRTLCDTRDLNR